MCVDNDCTVVTIADFEYMFIMIYDHFTARNIHVFVVVAAAVLLLRCFVFVYLFVLMFLYYRLFPCIFALI